MKKIIFGLLVAFVALSFMGCPTVYADRDYDKLPVGDVVGDMNGDGIVLAEMAGVPGGYKTASFTYANDMTAWGGGNGTCNFKIRKVAGDWGGGDYGSTSVAADKLPDGVELGGEGNITITGLVAGKSYHFEMVTIAPTIKISLIED